jgi:hypothetical protein
MCERRKPTSFPGQCWPAADLLAVKDIHGAFGQEGISAILAKIAPGCRWESWTGTAPSARACRPGSRAPALKASRTASPPLPSRAPATSRILDMLASHRQVAVEVIDSPKHIRIHRERHTALAAKAARFGAADQPVTDRLLADRHRDCSRAERRLSRAGCGRVGYPA